MDEPLFELGDWAGDPLCPERERPTPVDLVARLSRPGRERRVLALIDQANEIVDDVLDLEFRKHELTATCLMWSGGNDSNVLAHLMRHRATHAVHANTGIGIEATRVHVRQSAAAWGLPLIEREPEPQDRYETYVLKHGFPGPAQHDRVFQRLKQRTFEDVTRRFNKNPYKQRILFLAGRRRTESQRRAGLGWTDRKGSTVWAAPLINWTKLDLNTYRLMHPDTPHNAVSDILHMSGECLCGSKAHKGELEHLRSFYPDIAAYLDDLGDRARANGVHPDVCVWGWGWNQEVKQRVTERARLSNLCGFCDTPNLFSFENTASPRSTAA